MHFSEENMKVVGIIAEYNPFHNGHQYQIEELRKQTEADYVIVAMSGNFLQRGVPALCDKYSRTRMALSCGADLVLELPAIWATASAEYFAAGGVNLLKNTGVVTHLGFGAESDDLDFLRAVAKILKKDPPIYHEILEEQLKKGRSYPAANEIAIAYAVATHSYHGFFPEKISSILNKPNNILATQYLKFLPKKITPVLIPRKGASYHDTNIDTDLPSATAIRQTILTEGGGRTLESSMPKAAFSILQNCAMDKALVNASDISDILGYKLLMSQKCGYADYADCNEDLSNKISNHLNEYTDFEAFCQLLNSKDMTYARISRVLLHILLDMKQSDYTAGKRLGYAPYLRVLGFRKDATELLSAIKKEASVPLITKVADAASILDAKAYKMFEQDIYTSSVYHQLLTVKKKQDFFNDYTHPIVIL